MTPQGQIVADTARNIEHDIAAMRGQLGLQSSARPYRIGIIDSLAHLLFVSGDNSRLLDDVEVAVDNSRRIIDDLDANRIVAGIITGQPRSIGGSIVARKLQSEEFVFVRTSRPESGHVETQITDWLAFNRESTSFSVFARQFKQAGLVVDPIFYSTSMELLKDMAMAGKGTALLPRHFVQSSVDRGELAVLTTPLLYRPIWIITRKGTRLPMLTQLTTGLDVLLADIDRSGAGLAAATGNQLSHDSA
ncbi:MAG TPA: substrate-binding domain-containing protein [Candidatus Saccharimonadales bacterium]